MNKELKIRLVRFDDKIDVDEHIQEISYKYSLEDSSGLLEINLTIPEEDDPLRAFIYSISNLYKYNVPIDYIVYHGKYKHILKYYNCKSVKGYMYYKRKMY